MDWLVGLDEAGRGPVLGPLVVGVCSLPAEDNQMLIQQGVRDSKDLSAKRRGELERWFHEQAKERAWFGATITLPAERIDLALRDEGLNLLEIQGFQEALHLLPNNTNLKIMADACDVNVERFTQRILSGLNDWPWTNSTLTSEHKADQHHAVVAMASILAKVVRDRAVQAMEERVGFPIGSGYPSDSVTQKALFQLCLQQGIDPDVRWSWGTVERFWEQHRNGDVPQRGIKRTVQQTLFQDDRPTIS
jgi:ribonuclease HII